MVVAIRLARGGVKHAPLFYIVAAHSKFKRDGRHLEKLGTYDPLPTPDKIKHVSLNFERTKYWLSVGAQPTETVSRLLGMAGVLPPWPKRQSTITSVPKEERRAAAQAAKKSS